MALKFVTGTETTKQTLNPSGLWGDGDQLFVANSGNLLVDGDVAAEVAANNAKAVVRGAIYSTGDGIATKDAWFNDYYGPGFAPEFSGFRLQVDAGGMVAGGGHGVRIIGDGTAINNAGLIEGNTGIRLDGDSVSVVNTGEISGGQSAIAIVGNDALVRNGGTIQTVSPGAFWSNGISVSGMDGRVENTGTITSAGTAVSMGDGGALLNDGLISGGGSYATVVVGLNATVTNSGTIVNQAGEAVLASNYWGSSAGSFHLVNTGTIAGEGNAIRLQDSNGGDIITGSIVNQGSIQGGIEFSGGNDTYDGRLGQISGVIFGGGGNDTVLGGAHDETVEGGAGRDEVRTGAGDDVVHGGAGADAMDGGAGTDLLMYSLSSAGVAVNLATGRATGGDAHGDRFTSFENLWGSNHNDRLAGDAGDNQVAGLGGNDTIDGGAGNDELLGVDGDDVLRGGEGNDLIEGGQGKDILWTDAGLDTFRFRDVADSSATAAGRDVINGFVQGDDILDLALIDAHSGIAGDQAFTFRGTAGFTGAGGELRYVQTGGNTVVYADADGDKAVDFAFVVTGLHTLTADDFVL